MFKLKIEPDPALFSVYIEPPVIIAIIVTFGDGCFPILARGLHIKQNLVVFGFSCMSLSWTVEPRQPFS